MTTHTVYTTATSEAAAAAATVAAYIRKRAKLRNKALRAPRTPRSTHISNRNTHVCIYWIYLSILAKTGCCDDDDDGDVLQKRKISIATKKFISYFSIACSHSFVRSSALRTLLRFVDQFYLISFSFFLFILRMRLLVRLFARQCETNRCAVCIYEKFISFNIELNNRTFPSRPTKASVSAHHTTPQHKHRHQHSFALHSYCLLFCICFHYLVFACGTKQYRINANAFFSASLRVNWSDLGAFSFHVGSQNVMSLQFFKYFSFEDLKTKTYRLRSAAASAKKNNTKLIWCTIATVDRRTHTAWETNEWMKMN